MFRLCSHDALFAKVDPWLKLPAGTLTREQQAVIDVLYSIVAIEGDGLHGFWNEHGHEFTRIVESYRLAGFETLADALEESAFCADVMGRGLDAEGHWRFTEAQDRILSSIERTIYSSTEKIHDRLSKRLLERPRL